MTGKAKERWMELCEQAAIEQDRDSLLKLLEEISGLLVKKKNDSRGSGVAVRGRHRVLEHL